jgi:hypothetical protein
MKHEPQAVLRNWMAHVNQCNLEGVLSLYHERAVLIPTFSNRLLADPARIREYFERLCSREELSLALHEKTLVAHSMPNNVQVLAGIYCWRFAVDGELLNFEARFSFLIDNNQSKPIVHHHSSQIPRTL